MTLPFFLLVTAPQWAPAGLRAWRRIDLGYLIRLATPVAATVLLIMLYNWIRFRTIADVTETLYVLRAPLRLETAAASLGIAAVAAVDFMFGNQGPSQFGHRFAMDFYPLLILLAARGMRDRVPRLAKVLIVLGVAVNARGVPWARRGWVAP